MDNYEQKYNEILEWARKNKARLNGVPIEEVLPELAESEDERIRKKMIEHFKSKTKDTWCNMPVKSILAWLEKQKEQKPAAESISQLTVQGKGVYKICPRCKERMVRDDSKVYTSMPPQYGYDCPKCGYSEFDTTIYDSPVADEQKLTATINGEHIPTENYSVKIPLAEWSDTDNIGWDEAFACVTRAEKAAKNEEELQNAVTAEKWLKEIKFKYYVHPVKQEWSEEDEEVRETIIAAITAANMSTDCKKQVKDWLKSLKPQSQVECDTVKGIAWLEEHFFDNSHHSGRSDYGRIESDDFDSMEEMFASFRKEVCTSPQSHWKPSEEQLKHLLLLADYFESEGAISNAKTLRELYEDLKKL